MKKIHNALMLAGLAMSLLSCNQAKPSDASSDISEPKEAASFAEKKVNVYMGSLNSYHTTTLHFYDKEQQIPYVELSEAMRLRKALFDSGFTYETTGKSTYEVSKDGSKYSVTTNSRGHATFDVEKQTFYIQNIGLLQAYSYNSTPYDILPYDTTKSSSIKYVTHQTSSTGVRASYYLGTSITISLSDYGIPLYEDGEKAYIPLDLFNNFFMSYTYNNFIYSGKNVYAFSTIASETESSKNYLAEFYRENSKSRSKELAEFAYNSLALNLDYQYGLTSQHGFGDFRTEFAENGLKEGLLSTDSATYLKALYGVIYNMFGDGHCSMGNRSSYISEEQENTVKTTFTDYNVGLRELMQASYEVKAARASAYAAHPEYNAPYYVDGDTAYVTFDSFSSISGMSDYYSAATTGSESDTFGVINYANKMIKADSNVKNVVIDLTSNGGGEEIALAFALGWVMGNDAHISVHNPLTHCNATTYYLADVDLDGEYDETKDTLKGYNTFILTSKYSYSCANVLPCLAKASNKARIIGQTSGGGTCQVFPLITTDGTVMNISGNVILSTENNSHYQDIDEGAYPDYVISDVSRLNDRAYTTKIVDSMVL